MNFVMFPMFFFSSALYPLWKLREGGSEAIYLISMANPFTHAVEMIRYALYGMFRPDLGARYCLKFPRDQLLSPCGYTYDPQRGMTRRGPQPA